MPDAINTDRLRHAAALRREIRRLDQRSPQWVEHLEMLIDELKAELEAVEHGDELP